MAGIIRRAVFMAKGNDGYYRFSDWCRVTTELGAMIEPFTFARDKIQKTTGGEDFSWKDAAVRIDDVQGYDPTCQIFDDRTVGGPLTPVQGY